MICFSSQCEYCIPLAVPLSTRFMQNRPVWKTNWNLIYWAINVTSLKRKTVRYYYYFSAHCNCNVITVLAFHFSLAICRINTITLSATVPSCTLAYFYMHSNAYSLHRCEMANLKSSSGRKTDLKSQQQTPDTTSRMITQQFILIGLQTRLHRVLHDTYCIYCMLNKQTHRMKTQSLVEVWWQMRIQLEGQVYEI